MAASDPQSSEEPERATPDCLPAAALLERLEEEINRAGRHGTPLSCLLVGIEDLAGIEREHGRDLCEQALAYVGLALRREFRAFDRVGRPTDSEFVVVLPGADGARGEIVARRALARLRAIKLEIAGERRALRLAVGIAPWREGLNARQLIAETRGTVSRERLGFPDAFRL